MQSKYQRVSFDYLIEQQRIEERKIQIAKSILDSIDQLESEPDAVKRWGWELLQNAQDASNDNISVKVRIVLEKNKLRFMHNGKPFSLKDIQNLVEKGSDKDRPELKNEEVENEDDFDSFTTLNTTRSMHKTDQVQIQDLDEMIIPETTGRFGTGFLTTYLLSKKVKVEGVFNYNQQGMNIYKKFELILNRDTKSVKQMLQYNSRSSEVYKNLDDDEKWPPLNYYEPGIDFDTCFSYYLSDIGMQNAKEGLLNLYSSTPYVLAFSKKLEIIEIFDMIEQKEKIFRIDRKPISNSKNVSLLKYYVNDNEQLLIKAESQKSSIACFVQKKQEGNVTNLDIIQMDSNVPNFFVDYPLIGSTPSNISVVFNSHIFYPNEKRSGICLDQNLGFKAKINGLVMQDLAKLFSQFLDVVIQNGFSSIHHLRLSINSLNDNSSRILRTYLFEPIIKKFVSTKIIELQGCGRAELKNIKIPDISERNLKPENQQQVIDLWEILNIIYKNDLLIKRDFLYIQNWIQVFYDPDWNKHFQKKNKVAILDILKDLNNLGNVEDIQSTFNLSSYSEVQTFMESIYRYLVKYKNLTLNEEIKDYRLFINQRSCLSKFSSLMYDDNIDEYYKSLLQQYKFDLKSILFTKDFYPTMFPDIPKMTVNSLDEALFDSVQQVLGNLKNLIKPIKLQSRIIRNYQTQETLLRINNIYDLQQFCYSIIGLEKAPVVTLQQLHSNNGFMSSLGIQQNSKPENDTKIDDF
ncbi:histidine kinase [Stylonychia lemnae]|uniref:Histidine kinase n=1 Tax=Stylonychia lemnae TaxID=5949 RepID=A0A078B1W7_STYLE|nr:histidine kinase [Stylonychia lemnae]|eukprot:CDW87323.1 histidine kinase [Stylonychia lemnae]